MTYITLIAVIAIVLAQWAGTIPQSSVGGPMTLVLVFLVAALAVGIHEAWSRKRGALGWIVSIFASLAGTFLATLLPSRVIEPILMRLGLEVPMADTDGLLIYVLLAGLMLLTLLGSWVALWVVNRLR
jgi:hypothetical protein